MLATFSILLQAYVINVPPQSSRATPLRMLAEDGGPLAAVQKAYAIFQASKEEGMDFKQSVADAIAGEYDRDAITAHDTIPPNGYHTRN